MDQNLDILGGYLNEIGLSPRKLKTLSGRKKVQKSVYLVQSAGADLGYRFQWYKHGPYSAALASDYFALVESDGNKDRFPNQHQLWRSYKEIIHDVKSIFEPDTKSSFKPDLWLELMASWHYLQKISRYAPEEAEAILRSKKKRISSRKDFQLGLELVDKRLKELSLLG